MTSQPDLTTLRSLLARVREVEGQLADDDLGRLICAIEGQEFGCVEISTGDDGADEFSVYNRHRSRIYSEYRSRCPDVSIDAAVALVDRVLPGVAFTINSFDVQRKPVRVRAVKVHLSDYLHPNRLHGGSLGDGRTEPLALLDALLQALIARAEAETMEDVG